MRIDVIGKHMEVTGPIRSFVEQKAGKLPKHLDLVQQITVRLEQDPRKKGYHVEVVVDVEKHDDVVSNAHDADLYTSVDLAIDKAARQLTTFKEKLKQSKRAAGAAKGSKAARPSRPARTVTERSR